MAILGMAVNGTVVGVEGVGADPDALVYLASLTKPVVSTASMCLAARALFDLSAALTDRRELTATHVLTHTSGLPEVSWPDALAAWPARPAGLDAARTAPLAFAPGTAVAYSTLAFELLAAELTSVTGLRLEALLRRELFAPLGMLCTTFDPGSHPAVAIQGLTAGLDLSPEDARARLIALRLAGAGLWSTAADLLRLGMAVLASGRGEHDLLPSSAVDLMGSNQVAGLLEHGSGARADRGLGWRRGMAEGQRLGPGGRVLEHDGAAGGCIWLDRDADQVVVFLTSTFDGTDAPWRRVVGAAYD